MRNQLIPMLVLTVAALVMVAAMTDLAAMAGRALTPWFGWMSP
jgi:tryptophan-rich sensory protein